MYNYKEEGAEKFVTEAVNAGYRKTMGVLPFGLFNILLVMYIMFMSVAEYELKTVNQLFLLGLITGVLWAGPVILDKKKGSFSPSRKWLHGVFAFSVSFIMGMIGFLVFPYTTKTESVLEIVILIVLIVFSAFTYYAAPGIMYPWCFGLSLGVLRIFTAKGSLDRIWIYAIYFMVLLFVVYASHSIYDDFIKGYVYKAMANEEKKSLSSLLNDFEEGADDWVWELDEQLKLVYITKRITDFLSSQFKELYGMPVMDIISRMLVTDQEKTLEETLIMLEYLFSNQRKFENVVLIFRVKDKKYWIQFSAKPKWDDEGKLIGWIGVCRNVTEVVKYEQKLKYEQDHDKYTGLYNRSYLDRQIEKITPKDRGILVLIELMNDADLITLYGYEKRTEVIKTVLARLPESDNTVYARVGSDKFAVLILDRSIEPKMYLDHLQSIVQHAITVEGLAITAQFRMGARYFDQEDVAEQLFQQAYIALIGNHDSVGRIWDVYNKSIEKEVLDQLSLITEIGEGILKKQFFMMYQPQYRARTGEIESVEALVRWNHPSRGLVSPDAFITLAEKSGKIVDLGYYILWQTCSDAVTWQHPWPVSVNIAARQLQEDDFVEWVENILDSTGLPWHRLTIEVTESVFIGESHQIINKLEALSQMGASISMDDFGTGYSSMNYLSRLPLNELKIDRFFIWNMKERNNKAIVEMTIGLAKRFDLTVVAEGIETEEQADMLREMACDKFQGYLYSKPLLAGEMRVIEPRSAMDVVF